MAVQYLNASLDLSDFTAEREQTVSGARSQSEISLGAFRGLAFALIIETTLVTLGGIVWQILRMLF